jgi:NADPH:quinone reductase-like Zn-dependent oxidoreductase
LLNVFVSRWFASQKVVFFVAKITTKDLNVIKTLVEEGKVMPIIDRHYSFAEVPEALTYQQKGHARAKVVVTVA